MDYLAWLRNTYIDVWEIRKHKLYDGDSGPGQQLYSRSSPGERNGKFSQNGKFGQNGKLGHSCTNVTTSWIMLRSCNFEFLGEIFMAPGSVIMLLCI